MLMMMNLHSILCKVNANDDEPALVYYAKLMLMMMNLHSILCKVDANVDEPALYIM